MTEWDLVIRAGILKEKQTAMQEYYTQVIDALNGIKNEVILLGGIWKGYAGESFLLNFNQEWEKACTYIEETGALIAAYAQIEDAFERCENEIDGIL